MPQGAPGQADIHIGLQDRIMKIFRLLDTFRQDEDGAVTVDWVVLTAAVVSLAFAALFAVRQATGGLTTKIANHVDSLSIQTTF